MEQRFGNVILRETVIRRGNRAHAVRGVTAAVIADPRSIRRTSGWVQRLLQSLRRSEGNQRRLMLTIEGPGFLWRISIDPKRQAAAQAFATDVNRAARRLAA